MNNNTFSSCEGKVFAVYRPLKAHGKEVAIEQLEYIPVMGFSTLSTGEVVGVVSQPGSALLTTADKLLINDLSFSHYANGEEWNAHKELLQKIEKINHISTNIGVGIGNTIIRQKTAEASVR